MTPSRLPIALLATSLWIAAGPIELPAAEAQARRPNIVLIFVDDK